MKCSINKYNVQQVSKKTFCNRAFLNLSQESRGIIQIGNKITSGIRDKLLASLGDESKRDIVVNAHNVQGSIFGEAGLVFHR